MNLRLPVVISVVAVASGVAYVRSLHPATPIASFERVTDAPTPAPHSVPLPTRSANVVVYVAGAVAHRGVYRLPLSARADDAVRAAGGTTATADMVAVNLAMPLADGDAVIVPEKGAESDSLAASHMTRTSAHPKRRHRAKRHKRRHRAARPDSFADGADAANAFAATTGEAEPSAPIDLNRADPSQLETLPGVGTKLAERIVTYRELNGPFAAHDDLLDVAGMTQKRLEAIEPFLL